MDSELLVGSLMVVESKGNSAGRVVLAWDSRWASLSRGPRAAAWAERFDWWVFCVRGFLDGCSWVLLGFLGGESVLGLGPWLVCGGGREEVGRHGVEGERRNCVLLT